MFFLGKYLLLTNKNYENQRPRPRRLVSGNLFKRKILTVKKTLRNSHVTSVIRAVDPCLAWINRWLKFWGVNLLLSKSGHILSIFNFYLLWMHSTERWMKRLLSEICRKWTCHLSFSPHHHHIILASNKQWLGIPRFSWEIFELATMVHLSHQWILQA